jgi:hypothetical protein
VRVAWGVFGFLLAWAVGGQAAEIERLGPTTSGEFRRRWAATEVTCGSEDLVEMRAFKLELDPAGRARAEAMRAAWRDCRWKAMRAMGEPGFGDADRRTLGEGSVGAAGSRSESLAAR